MVIEQTQLRWVKYVFAIVQNQASELDGMFFLIASDVGNDMIETIRFARGARVGESHVPQATEAPGKLFDLGACVYVIRVGAYKDNVIFVGNRPDRVFDHGSDHIVLFPCGNHYRQMLLGFFYQFIGRNPCFLGIADFPKDLDGPEHAVDEQVIKR